jgi:hypothetical protein
VDDARNAFHLGRLDLPRPREEPAERKILGAVGEAGARLLAVTAGAAKLLVVGVEGVADVVVVDEADVRLVHAHPERDRPDDHLEVVVHEVGLDGIALLRGEPRVVRLRVDVTRAERLRHLLGPATRGLKRSTARDALAGGWGDDVLV